MPLNNPQIQFVRYKQTGLADRFFIYVTSHFSVSNYENNGVDSISGPDANGKLTLNLKVSQSGLGLRLNKPIVHQVEIEGIDPDAILETEVNIYNGSTLNATAILQHDESETVVKPTGQTRRL
jgi:hypothetical protein